MKKSTLFLVILWRIVLFFVSFIGEKLLPFVPRFPYSDVLLIPSGLPRWIWAFSNFDGVHYLTISKQGYSAQYTQVFFPLFPLLIKFFSNFFPHISRIVIGLGTSTIFFFLSAILFWKLVSLDYKRSANWIVLFFIFFPTSFFFGSLYTESVFLFFVLASFYSARKKRWLLASLCASFATSTRLIGIFLLPSLLWEWLQNKKEKTFLSIFISPITYIVPIGLLLYMTYLQFQFHDALYFWHMQPVFGAERSGGAFIFLPQVFWRYGKMLLTIPFYSDGFRVALTELMFTLFAFVTLFIAHQKNIRLSYLIFSWLAILLPTLTGTLSSMPRYILVAFPIYFVLGMIKNFSVKLFLFILEFTLLLLFTLLFTSGIWVA